MQREEVRFRYWLKSMACILAGITFLITTNTAAAPEEKSTTLVVNGHWPSFSITACQDDQCTDIPPSDDMLKALDQGYTDISAIDLTRDWLAEIMLTHNENGGVNFCAKVYQYDLQAGTLHPMGNVHNQLCNVSIKDDRIVSRYRSGAMWHEDIYRAENNSLMLEFSDSCVGCDHISRTIYSNDEVTETLLVTDQIDYRLRAPLSTAITSEKAFLYSDPTIDHPTKMYLVKNDNVTLTRETSDDRTFWYKVRYISRNGKTIDAWLQCSDIAFCEK